MANFQHNKNTMKGKQGWIHIILGISMLVLNACASLALPLPLETPKSIAKGTSTSTPFQPAETFTLTPDAPPSLIPSSTPLPSFTPTGAPTGSPTLETTPTVPTETVTPTLLPTTAAPSPTAPPTQGSAEDSPPTVKVSVTTNCRTGPGVGYTRISSLSAGQQARVVGRNPTYPYWIIRDPWGTGSSCWLWNNYASVQGDTSSLPVIDPPAAPTALPTGTPTGTATPDPAQPSSTPRPPTATNPPPTATREITPGTPTDTPTPGPTATPAPTNTPAPTPTDTPVPPPTATSPSPYCSYTSVLSGEENQIKNMINQARQNHGLPALSVDNRLVTAARDHGRDMTCNGMWGHTSSDGTRAWERIGIYLGYGRNWCYSGGSCAEIYYSGNGAWLTPSKAFDWWMNHESQNPDYEDNIHKRSILSPYQSHLGVGVIYYNDGSTTRKFYTVDFARP